jgi:quinol monooxygenase YgiN
MSKIAVIAKFTAASGRRDEVAASLDDLMAHVDSEAGTELYILHEDPANPDVLWLYELYADSDALQAHSSSPAMMALFQTLGGDLMGAPPELSVVNPVRGKGAGL